MSERIIEITGPLLFGHLFNWALFGTLTVQVYIFFIAVPNNPWILKGIVLFIYFLEILQTALSARDAFRDYGSGWGDITVLGSVGWMWFSVPIMSAIISLTAQMFYAWRVWLLSSGSQGLPTLGSGSLGLPNLSLRRLSIPAIIVTLSLVSFSAAVYSGSHARSLGTWSEVESQLYTVSAVWLIGTALCDTVITASMTYYVYWFHTRVKHTNGTLIRLIHLTIETGAICSTFAVVDCILFIRFNGNSIHLPMCMALAELYGNSLLMVLNSRVRIVQGSTTEMHASSISTINFRLTAPRGRTTNPALHNTSPIATVSTESFDSCSLESG